MDYHLTFLYQRMKIKNIVWFEKLRYAYLIRELRKWNQRDYMALFCYCLLSVKRKIHYPRRLYSGLSLYRLELQKIWHKYVRLKIDPLKPLKPKQMINGKKKKFGKSFIGLKSKTNFCTMNFLLGCLIHYFLVWSVICSVAPKPRLGSVWLGFGSSFWSKSSARLAQFFKKLVFEKFC